MTDAKNPDPLLLEAARFASHPDFPAAVHAYAVGLIRFRESPRLVNMIVSTDVRWRIVGYLLYLNADRERFGPEGGATYGRLLDLCTRRGEASPRAVKTLLAILNYTRFVRTVASAADRRVKFYKPTERMDGFRREWLRYGTAALDILQPHLHRGRFIDDPAFLETFDVSGGRAYLEDPVSLADRVPEPLSLLKSMLGSYSVILAVLVAHLTQAVTPSRHSIARRFGLSRSQVDNVVRAGQDKGLFALDRAGQLVPTPALHDSFQHWIAIELAFYARHMRPPGLLPSG